MEERNVIEILSAADDSVSLINGISDGSIVRSDLDQSEINAMVQRNVDHLEIILAYQEVIDDSSDKTAYTTAIATGNAYITANS